MQGSLFVGRILGFRIGLHYTWLIALALITWSLADGVFPGQYPGWDAGAYWLAGFVAALALFASVIVHELAHSVVARSRGIGVEDITLFIFGGVARIKAEAATPWDEFLIAVVGPIASLVVAALAWLGSLVIGQGSGPMGAVFFYVASANAILAVFNLIPGFPLDGGRVLRAIIWGVTNSMERATHVSSVVGQLVGFGFIGIGVLQAFTGNIISGLWIIFIGWFINSGAETSRRQAEAQTVFRGVRVCDLMTTDPPTANPNISVSDFVQEYAVRRGVRALPVVVGDRLYGIVSITDASKVPTGEWETTPIASILTRDDLATVRPTDDANTALARMAERDVNQVLVMDGDRLVGLLSRASILQYMRLRSQFGYAPPRRRPGTPVCP